VWLRFWERVQEDEYTFFIIDHVHLPLSSKQQV
jgi:hypothetical protein